MEVDVSPKLVIPAQIPHLSKLHHCIKDVSPLKTGKFSSFLNEKEKFQQIFKHEQENFLDYSFNNQNLSFFEYIDARRLPMLLQTVRMGVQKLEIGARKNLFDAVEYSTVRSNICNLFRAVLTAMDQCSDMKIIEKYVNLIRPLWHPVVLTSNLKEIYVSCYDCSSTEYVKGQLIASSAKFHNIHGFLEGRWFYLEYLLKKTVMNSESDSEKMTKISLIDTEYEAEYKLFVADIVTICLLTYSKSLQDRHTIFEIFEQKSIFPCVCFLDVLYAMVSLSDFLRPVHHFGQFSDYFDEIMSVIEEDRFPAYIQSLCDRLEARKFFARLVPQEIPKFKPEQLNIFKINCLLRILKVDPIIESELIEGIRSSLMTFVKSEPNEEQLRAMLLLMTESFTANWDTKCDLISIFFDCIYKRINSPFFMPNSRVDSLTVVESTPQNFLGEVQKSLENDKILNHHSTSFNILLHIIGKSLTKQRLMGQKSVSNKLLGRIFSKFSISKIITLSERGLHNFVLLVVTLACSCELSEFGNRLFDILLQIQYNKLLPDRQKVLVKGHLSLLILFVDRKLSFGKHIERIVNQLKENVADQKSLWELLSSSIRIILGEKRCFEEGTNLLIGNWIPEYISNTTENEKREFFTSVNDILGYLLTIDRTSEISKIIKGLFDNFLKTIKTHYLMKKDFDGLFIPQIATKFTSLASISKTHEGLPSFESLINFFGDTMRPNIKNCLKFYTNLSDEDILKVSPELLMQNWIKFEILSSDLPNDELETMRFIVLMIPEISEFAGESIENIKNIGFGGPAPLLFFKAVFEKYYRMDNYNTKTNLVKTVERYLNNFTKWAVMNVETSNVFRFSASLLKYCAPMIYSKMNHSCIFNQIFDKLVLTHDVMMSKQPSLAFCKNMAMSFPAICNSLTNMNFQQDKNLEEKFTNLVTKWTFLLAKADSDMTLARKTFILLCKNGDDETLRMTLKIFSENFLNVKKTPENVQIGVQIYKSVYNEVIKLDDNKVGVVLNGSIDELLEQILLFDEKVAYKKTFLDILKDFLSVERTTVNPGIETSVVQSLKKMTEKRKLLQNKSQFFQLLQKLLKINVNIVDRCLPHLNQAILDIEAVYGRNNDAGLRNAQGNLIKMVSHLKNSN